MREIKEFLEIVKSSRKAYVFTGAGVSTPSGIPDFRGRNGLYQKISPDVFDIERFYEDPKRFYEFYRKRLRIMKEANPNIAHRVIAEMERKGMIDWVITQNIDGLHKKAGSNNVVELHGTMERYICTSCGTNYDAKFVEEELLKEKDIPNCPKCGGVLKPDVVFFGEPLPEFELLKAYRIAEESDLSIVVGSSLVVYPAAMIPRITVESGGKLLIVNLGETGLDKLAYRKYEYDISEFFSKLAEELGVN
jgi:NAD-dependent deacetylase